MPLLGQLALWLAVLLAVWGALAGITGARQDRPDLEESARRAAIALAGSLAAALGCLLTAVLWQDFRLAYVAAHADRATPSRDAWAVLLDGAGGRWLVGAALLAGFVVAARHFTRDDARVRALALAVGCAACGAVVAAVLFAARPFAPLTYTPVDGSGLSQRLYDLDTRFGLLIRCAAYALAVVPAARLVAARRIESDRWTVAAWLLLTLDVGWSLWLASHDAGEAGWITAALWRPALALWLVLGVVVHTQWRRLGVGAHLAHAGAVIVAGGLVAAAGTDRFPVQLRPGESAAAGKHSVTYLASSIYPAANQIVTQGLLQLRRGDQLLGRIAALRRQQIDVFGRARFAPALRAGRWTDLRETVTAGWVADSSARGAEFIVAVVPLAPWLWLGWCLLGVGGIVALWRSEETP